TPSSGGSGTSATTRSKRGSAPRSGTNSPAQRRSAHSSPRASQATGVVQPVPPARDAAGLDTSVQSGVLSTPVPNAFALPGGKVYLFNGLLAKADNAESTLGRAAAQPRH